MMDLNDGEFEARDDCGLLKITIKQESDCSSDGGYTFETVSNTYCLDKDEAQQLLDKLNVFLDHQS